MISSAHGTASEPALTVDGTDGTFRTPSTCCSFLAAGMLAAIRSTRLRPSSMRIDYHIRLMFAMEARDQEEDMRADMKSI
jgi:hypothetical protein